MDELPRISVEDHWRQVWHTNCPKWMQGYPERNPTSGIFYRDYDFFETADGTVLRLFVCGHCGVKVFAGTGKDNCVKLLTHADVLRERWIAGFKEIAKTLSRATPEDRQDAVDLLLSMGKSDEEMKEGEETLRELLSAPEGRLIVLVERDKEQL